MVYCFHSILPYWNLAFNQSSYQYFNKTRLQNYKNKLIGRGTPSGKGRDHPSRRAKKSLVRKCLSFIGNTTLEWICPRYFAARKTDLCATNHTLLLSDDNIVSSAGSPVWNIQLLSQYFHVATYFQIGNPRINLSGSDIGMSQNLRYRFNGNTIGKQHRSRTRMPCDMIGQVLFNSANGCDFF